MLQDLLDNEQSCGHECCKIGILVSATPSKVTPSKVSPAQKTCKYMYHLLSDTAATIHFSTQLVQHGYTLRVTFISFLQVLERMN